MRFRLVFALALLFLTLGGLAYVWLAPAPPPTTQVTKVIAWPIAP